MNHYHHESRIKHIQEWDILLILILPNKNAIFDTAILPHPAFSQNHKNSARAPMESWSPGRRSQHDDLRLALLIHYVYSMYHVGTFGCGKMLVFVTYTK